MGNLLAVFGLSFVTALSGALQPGPLLTYTVMQTLKAPRRGWLTGARIVAGHAVVELVIIVALLSGLSLLLANETTVRVIGSAGAAFMLVLAALVFRDVFVKKVTLPAGAQAVPQQADGSPKAPPADRRPAAAGPAKKKFLDIPEIGGALISMSNPFWWVWWATLGFFFMREYGVSLASPALLAAFFLGHELGDLVWYWGISILLHTGRRLINQTVYRVILVLTAVLLIGFAGFILYSAFQYRV